MVSACALSHSPTNHFPCPTLLLCRSAVAGRPRAVHASATRHMTPGRKCSFLKTPQRPRITSAAWKVHSDHSFGGGVLTVWDTPHARAREGAGGGGESAFAPVVCFYCQPPPPPFSRGVLRSNLPGAGSHMKSGAAVGSGGRGPHRNTCPLRQRDGAATLGGKTNFLDRVKRPYDGV